MAKTKVAKSNALISCAHCSAPLFSHMQKSGFLMMQLKLNRWYFGAFILQENILVIQVVIMVIEKSVISILNIKKETQHYTTCADPEIFMRGGPTKMVIFGRRRGGVQPSKNPEITFF